MSLPSLITHVINLFCGTYLTWLTSKSFHQVKEGVLEFDNLLIRWYYSNSNHRRIILYLLIYLEAVFIFFVDWIPIVGGLIALLPFCAKIYVILPHSQGYLKVYGLLEQMELDDQTGRIMSYVQTFTKYLVIRSLKIIENWVDLIQSQHLDEVEEALQRINQQIVDKRAMMEVRKSFVKFTKRNDDESPKLAAPRNTEVFRSHYETSKIKRQLEEEHSDDTSLVLIAGVLVKPDEGDKPAVFEDYKLVFNVETCELAFYDLPTNTLQYRKALREIQEQNKKTKCLHLVFDDFEEIDDDAYTTIKLRDLNDTVDWLKPVLKILVERLQQFDVQE